MGCSSSKIDNVDGIVPSSNNNNDNNKIDEQKVRAVKRANSKLVRQKTRKDVEKSYLMTTCTCTTTETMVYNETL